MNFRALACWLLAAAAVLEAQDWTHYVRIAGHSLRLDNVDQIIRSATDTGVFGIEVDNDIPGRYESFLDPSQKLQAIREAARKAHAAGNYAFVYIAGTECITARAAAGPHSMGKDHPDWVQRKINGEPAMFGGGTAFWIREGDEDVWISPFAPEWRKIYMERVRQIAGTGIDGVYVDIPYWMTHFKDWEDTWASFDDYTVAAFRAKTGLNAKTDLKLGDFRDANFRKWVDFRIDAITGFVREIDENVKSVNPKCKTIPEIYPGIEDPAVRVGSDVYELYGVVDTIAHEYSTGGKAASRTPLAWFQDMAGMFSFRAFAGTKPSWMLSYSWENEKQIAPAEAMQNLAMAQLMAGTNTWDARGHVMSGSNDMEMRTKIFGWMRVREKLFFDPREPMRPIGVYFSPKSRDYFAKEFIESYRGVLMLLMREHAEFQIVTPRTLAQFHGDALILPDARALGNAEVGLLTSYVQAGKALVVTGESGAYDDSGARRYTNPVLGMLGVEPGKRGESASGKRFLYAPECPGRAYYAELRKDFSREPEVGKTLLAEVLKISGLKPAVQVEASPLVATQISRVHGTTTVFLANFNGLKAKENATQIAEAGVKVWFAAEAPRRIAFLPFLGDRREIEGRFEGGRISCELPAITKGAVVWLE